MTGFAFHPEAETDLEEIWEYIAAKSASVAYRLIDIEKALKKLVLLSNRGFRHPNLSSGSLRFMTVPKYAIAYAPDKQSL